MTSQGSEVHKCVERWHGGKVTAGETVKGAKQGFLSQGKRCYASSTEYIRR